MKVLRNLLAAAFLFALALSFNGTGPAASAIGQPGALFSHDDKSAAEPAGELIKVYVANKDAIDNEWVKLGDTATVADAIQAWTVSKTADAASDHEEVFSVPSASPRAVSYVAKSNSRGNCSRSSGYSGDRKFGFRVRAVGGAVRKSVGRIGKGARNVLRFIVRGRR